MLNYLLFQWFLIVFALIATIDEYFFHFKKFTLYKHRECKKEVILHSTRQIIFGFIFFVIANLSLKGSYLLAFFSLFCIELFIGFWDVYEEGSSREKFNGLDRREYFLHMLLSFCLGLFYSAYFINQLPLIKQPDSWTFIEVSTLPQIILNLFAFGSFLLGILGCISTKRNINAYS